MWCFVFVILCFSSLTTCKGSEVLVNCEENKTIPTTSAVGVSATEIYKFYDNERVFISCNKSFANRITSDSIAFIDNTTRQIGKDRTPYLYIKLTETLKNKYVDCETIYKNNRINKTRIIFERSSSNIRFPKKPCHSFDSTFEECYNGSSQYEKKNNCAFPVPVIEGLLKDKILAVFYYDKKSMVIAYEYNKMGEEIDLQCIPRDHTWIWEGVQKNETGNNATSTFRINNPTMAFVECHSGSVSTKIIFKYETLLKRAPKKTEQDTDPNEKAEGGFPLHSGDLANDQGGAKNADNTTTGPHDGHYALIIGGGVTVIILVLVVVFVCLIKILKKKPKTPNPDVNINYETLPEHNQGAMPTPRQWQEALYSLPNDRIANNDYAVPHQPTLEDMYTAPIPKNKRTVTPKDNLGYESVDELFAAKIVNSRPTLNKVLPTPAKRSQTNTCGRDKFDDNYSETASESPYAEVNFEEANVKTNAGYSNVFDGQRYVNSSSNKCDYAEPAYCEPSKVSK